MRMAETHQTKAYHGVVVPMVTPVTSGGELDVAAVCRVIDHILKAGIEGIFVLGTTGEDASIPLEMRSKLVEATVDHVSGRARVYAGISHNSLSASVEAANTYRRLGADVLVARLPTYYALDSQEQATYFESLIERIPGPLVLYNISSTTHMTVPLDVIESLSENPKVVGIKDSDGDPQRLDELLTRFRHRPDFSVFAGHTAFAARALHKGADGFVPSQGNPVPHLCQHLYECCLQGTWDAAEIAQDKLDQVGHLWSDLLLARSLGLLKAAMGVLDLCGPHVLPPLLTPTLSQQERVRRAFTVWLAEERV